MGEEIHIPLESLPQYGLRRNSQPATAIHRYPKPSPDDPVPPVPACVLADEAGEPSSRDPTEYVGTPTKLAVESERYSLCSKEACFGRLTAVRGATWDRAARGVPHPSGDTDVDESEPV
jgi:hypothetical protein